MRKALVLGGSGLVGERITSVMLGAGYSVDYTYLRHDIEIPGAQGHRLDMTDEQGLKDIVGRIGPDLIVNAAVLSSADQCEKEPELAFRMNAEPQRIIAQAAKPSACIVFISTAFVFGFSEKRLTEEDTPGPVCIHGKTKVLGERYTAAFKRHVILRPDQIYGWTRQDQRKTFVERTLEKLERGEIAEVCADWYNCPTYADDIAAAISKLVEGEHWGIFHTVGPTYLNRYDWAVRIAKAFEYDPALVRAIDSSKLNLPAKRPNCALSTEKIARVCGAHFLSVDEGLETMKANRSTPHP